MKLDTQAVQRFQTIYKKEFGKTLTEQEARERFSNLLSAFKVIYKPIPKNEMREDERKPQRKIYNTSE